MSEMWWNAVLTIRIPLDLPITASQEEVMNAVMWASERIEMQPDFAMTGTFELVEDGEPIADSFAPAPPDIPEED